MIRNGKILTLFTLGAINLGRWFVKVYTYLFLYTLMKNVNVQCVTVIAIVLLGVTHASMENANVTFIGYQTIISFIFMFKVSTVLS